MVLQNQSGEVTGTASVGSPGLLWVFGWTLLISAAFPVALILMPPLAVGWMGLSRLGTTAGLWIRTSSGTLEGLGFIISFGIVLSFFQWLMLRTFLPKSWKWFLATLSGILIGSLTAWFFIRILHLPSWSSIWFPAVSLFTVGLTLGVAHWLYLRKFLPQAVWIVLVDVLSASSLLLIGKSITSLAGFSIFLLPGAISGLGIWLLLRNSRFQMQSITPVRKQNKRRWVWIGLGIAALVPLLFGYLWVYAASQLALAKHDGIYPTVEQAVIAANSQGWGGAKVIDIQNVHAGPNRRDGAQPFVWFGGASVTYDRIPAGARNSFYVTGSYYMHVRDGWIMVPEGSFPEFIGRIMELYHMEGVDGNP